MLISGKSYLGEVKAQQYEQGQLLKNGIEDELENDELGILFMIKAC